MKRNVSNVMAMMIFMVTSPIERHAQLKSYRKFKSLKKRLVSMKKYRMMYLLWSLRMWMNC